jgi:hypothetical protein
MVKRVLAQALAAAIMRRLAGTTPPEEGEQTTLRIILRDSQTRHDLTMAIV